MPNFRKVTNECNMPFFGLPSNIRAVTARRARDARKKNGHTFKPRKTESLQGEPAASKDQQLGSEDEQASAEDEQASAEDEQAAPVDEQASAEDEQAAPVDEQTPTEPQQALPKPEQPASKPAQPASKPAQPASEPAQPGTSSRKPRAHKVSSPAENFHSSTTSRPNYNQQQDKLTEEKPEEQNKEVEKEQTQTPKV